MYTFGKYVQAKDNPKKTNTNAVRILDYLYLYSSNSKQIDFDLLHLPVNCTTQRKKSRVF